MRPAALLLILGCGDPAPSKAPSGVDSAPSGDGGGEEGATPTDSGGTGEDSGPPPDDSDDCIDDSEQFSGEVVPLLESDCIACHNAEGAASGTRYVLQPFGGEEALAANHEVLRALVVDSEDGANLLLEKPTGQTSHGGGKRFDVLDPEYAVLHELVARLQDPGHCAHPGEPPMTCEEGGIYPGSSPLRRLTDEQYAHITGELLQIEVDPGIFPATTAGDGFRTWAQLNTVSAAGSEQIMIAAELVVAAADADALRACAEGEAPGDCARRSLLSLGERAFRRPLFPEEQDLLTSFLDAGVEPELAWQMGVELMLQMPQFLYQEVLGSGEGDPERLSDYAIASRLALAYTQGLPDAELLEAAGRGELHSRAQVQAEALRLIRSPEALRTVRAFHRDWLHSWRLAGLSRDAGLYPDFSEDTVEAMLTELDLYTTEVIWSGEATYDQLFFSSSTWVNAELAGIYGLPAPEGGWARVELDPATRPGLLTRSAFLTAHAYSASSSPVRRGAWVLEQLLCEDLTPPVDVNMNLPEESAETPTIRERLAVHRADPACASCHDRIDPVGFSFEHYGPIGEWRDAWESGIPVDATGSLEEPAGDFDGAAEMISLVATSDQARSCYTRRWFEFLVGRPAEVEDACSLRTLDQRFAASGYDLHGLLVDIAMTDAFLYRHPETP